MKGKRLTNVLLIAGILFLCLSIGWIGYSKYSVQRNAARAESLVQTLYSLMPTVRDGAPDHRANPTMSALEISKMSFVGVVELPDYDCQLPIYSQWKRAKVRQFPCRYTGSVYDNSLIIGASDNDGQFDFIKQLSNGDSVYVVDTTGVRYTYTVTNILRTKDVGTENLRKIQADLTLFVQNSLNMDYTVVYCSFES